MPPRAPPLRRGRAPRRPRAPACAAQSPFQIGRRPRDVMTSAGCVATRCRVSSARRRLQCSDPPSAKTRRGESSDEPRRRLAPEQRIELRWLTQPRGISPFPATERTDRRSRRDDLPVHRPWQDRFGSDDRTTALAARPLHRRASVASRPSTTRTTCCTERRRKVRRTPLAPQANPGTLFMQPLVSPRACEQSALLGLRAAPGAAADAAMLSRSQTECPSPR